MRILYVTPMIQWPLAHGGQIRQWNILHALQAMGQLDVLVFQNPSDPLPKEVYEKCQSVYLRDDRLLKGVDSTTEQSVAYRSTFGRLRLCIGNRRPFRYLGPPTDELSEWFSRLTKEKNYNVIWISKAVTAVALNWRDKRSTILDGDNIDYRLNLQLLRSSNWYGAKLINYLDVAKLAVWERNLHRWFARVVRCSGEDQRILPGKNTVVIPNGTDIPQDYSRRPGARMLFVGTLGYEPNRFGVEWFLEKIWPRIRARLPSLQIDIVGSNPGVQIQDQNGKDGVWVHGFVRDLSSFWNHAQLSIAPLLAGSGTRLKILESLAHQVPVVSTKTGAEGIDLGENEGLFRADSEDRFADACVKLVVDECRNRQLGVVGQQAVAAEYSWPIIHKKIHALVDDVSRNQSQQVAMASQL